jgi:hypothetical protein
MTYEYRCIMCDKTYIICKPASRAGQEEYCDHCKLTLTRVWTAPRLNFMTLTEAEKNDVKRHKYETGSDLVCVGDDKKAVQALRPKMEHYDLPPEIVRKMDN